MNRLPASVPALSIALALGLPAGLLYDSNIFATRSDEVDDILTLFTPAVTLVSDWERHRLQARTGATLARYRDNGDEDYEDYWAELEGRYDISEAGNVFGGVGYTAEHEDRGSPDETLVGDEPTTFDSRHAHAGVAHRFGDYNLRLGGTFEALDYDSVGPLNNDDRDRDLIGLGARLGYEFHPDYEAYVQLIRDIRSYNDPVDDFGYQRDSDGERIALGFKGRFTNRLQGGAYVGWIRQAWDDSRFNDLSTPDFSGALSFRATPRTTVSAAVDRSLEETTLPGASGYLYTEASVNAVHRLDSRTRFSAGHGRGDRGRGGAKGGRGVHDFARGGGRSVEVKVFRGQRPVWAQEGIPEVELGRLNVSRAPAHVLARHEDEALARYSTEMAALYNLPADAAAQLLQTAYGETPRLDSPLQNLAMYEQVMVFGRTELEGIQAASAIDLAAIFLGTAADKNLPITEDTVIALNRILGLKEMPADERAALASRANTVREAILIGHGPETDH